MHKYIPKLALGACLGMGLSLSAHAQIASGVTLDFDANLPPDGTPSVWESNTTNQSRNWTFGGDVTLETVSSGNAGITSAYRFTGGAGGSNASFDSFNENADTTWEFWLNPADTGSANQTIFESGAGGDGITIWYVVGTADDNTGTLNFTIDDGSVQRTVSATLDTTDFQNVACVYDKDLGGIDLMQIYVNGVLIDDNDPATTFDDTTDSATNGLDDWAGGDGAGLGNTNGAVAATAAGGPYTGDMSVFRFWEGKALSATEVLGNYQELSGPDETAPTIGSLSPVNGATDVLGTTELVLAFSEFVDLTGNGTITIKNLDDGTGASDVTINLASLPDPNATVTVVDNELTIVPNTALAAGTNYAIQVSADAIVDQADTPNAFAGITDDITWAFLIDGTAPGIAALSPADEATGVYVGTSLTLSFDEPVQLTDAGSVTIKNLTTMSDTPITLPDAGVTLNGSDLTIVPPANLAPGTNYAVNISADAVEDVSTNDFAGILDETTWNFATVTPDGTAPVISSADPADDATDVSIFPTLVLTFDEDLVLGTGNITLYNVTLGEAGPVIDVTDDTQVTLAGNVLTITPPLLETSTEYAIQLDAGVVKNLNDLSSAAISDTTTLSFTTAAEVVYTWIQGGTDPADWDDPANWEGGAVPPRDTVGTKIVFGPNASGQIASDGDDGLEKVTIGSVTASTSFDWRSFGQWNNNSNTGIFVNSGSTEPAQYHLSNGIKVIHYYVPWKMETDLELMGNGAIQIRAYNNNGVIGTGGFIINSGTELEFDNTHGSHNYTYTGGVEIRAGGLVDLGPTNTNGSLGDGPLSIEETGRVILYNGGVMDNDTTLTVTTEGANPATNTAFFSSGGNAAISGAFTFDLSNAGITPGNQWQIFATVPSFDAAFTVASTGAGAWTETAGVWTGVEDGVVYGFDTATGVLEVISATASITSFEAAGATGVIDQSAKTIALEVPFGTDLATLAPTFTLSSGTCDQTSGAVPSPSFAAQNPIDYEVTDTATDPDTVNTYAVTVTVAPERATIVIDLGTSPAGTTIEGGAFIGTGPANLPIPSLPAGSILRSIAVAIDLESTDNNNFSNDLTVLIDPTPGDAGTDFSLGIGSPTATTDFGAGQTLNWAGGADTNAFMETITDADWSTTGDIDLAVSGLFLGNGYQDSGWTAPNGGTWTGTIELTYDVVAGGSDYDTWAAGFPGADLTDPAGDFDQDGLTNEQERVFGLNPADPASADPFIVPITAVGTFSYTRRDPALSGLTYSIWTSSDLENWTEDTGATEGAASTAGDVETVPVTLSATAVDGKLFVEVRAD